VGCDLIWKALWLLLYTGRKPRGCHCDCMQFLVMLVLVSRFASGRFSRGESRERGPVYQIKAMTEKAGTRQAGGLAGQRTTSPRLDSTRLDSTRLDSTRLYIASISYV